MELTDFCTRTKEFKQVLTAIQKHQRQLITGISGSARTLLLMALQKNLDQPQLVITDSLFHMQELAADLENLLPEEKIYQFPVEEVLAAEVATSSPNYRLQRVQALNALINNKSAIVIASTAGLRRNIVAPELFKQAELSLKVGGEIDPEKAADQLSSMGYQRQKMVLRPGDFAVRGSIIDIYSLNTDDPVRVDLFDTERKDKYFTFGFSTQPLLLHANLQSVDINKKNENNYDITCSLFTPDREMPETVESLVRFSEKADATWQHSPDGKRHEVSLPNIQAGTNVSQIRIKLIGKSKS